MDWQLSQFIKALEVKMYTLTKAEKRAEKASYYSDEKGNARYLRLSDISYIKKQENHFNLTSLFKIQFNARYS